MSTILIRQTPDDYADATGLSKYGRSRMPGTFDRLSAAINTDGRYITGVDEDALGLTEEQQKEAIALRTFLSGKIGKDLSAISDYWEQFEVSISGDKPKIFNTESPKDMLSYKMLIANRYVAPTKEDAFTPKYKDAQYYAYTEEGEVNEEVSSRKLRDLAIVSLVAISDNKDKMLLYGQYLEGLKYTDKPLVNDIYKLLRAFIEDKNINNCKNFIKAINEPIEKLQVKAIVDRALKQKLITRSNAGTKKQIYQYGQVTLGTSLEELYSNMALPDFAPELLSIKNTLENK